MASSLTGEGHDQIWSTLKRTVEAWKTSGWWQTQREVQRLEAMERHAKELLIEAHMSQAEGLWKGLQSQVRENSVSAYSAARTWIRGASNPQDNES